MTAKEIARVDAVRLGLAHGMLTLELGLDFGGTHVSFGGYELDAWDPSKKRRVGHPAGCDFVLRLFRLFGVDELDAITGRVVYALRDEPGGPIVGLESPPFDGSRRFLIADWHDEWFGKAPERGAARGKT
jgi:hypothetical protein